MEDGETEDGEMEDGETEDEWMKDGKMEEREKDGWRDGGRRKVISRVVRLL